MEQDMSARHGGSGLYLFKTSDGTTQELSAEEVQQAGVEIICNPFMTRFWPQNLENMTLIPVKYACTFPRAHSWRRMLLTSPPITSLSMSLWSVLPFSLLNIHCDPPTNTAPGTQNATTRAPNSCPPPATCPQV
jgi:hypothetical protein